jgi:hypothetical protein
VGRPGDGLSRRREFRDLGGGFRPERPLPNQEIQERPMWPSGKCRIIGPIVSQLEPYESAVRRANVACL